MKNHKVRRLALLVLLMVFAISGCASKEKPRSYTFLFSEEEIADISVVRICARQVHSDDALTKTPFSMEVAAGIPEQDWSNLLEIIRALPCCSNAAPPHQLAKGNIGIRVLYRNGDYEIFCGEVIAVHKDERYYSDGIRFCEASSLDALLDKYL